MKMPAGPPPGSASGAAVYAVGDAGVAGVAPPPAPPAAPTVSSRLPILLSRELMAIRPLRCSRFVRQEGSQSGSHDQRDHGGEGEAADHGDRERPLQLGAGAAAARGRGGA